MSGDRIGVSVTIAGIAHLFGRDLGGLIETARIADEVGIDQLVMADHLAIGPHTDRYPYGRFPFSVEEPWPEPLTTLAAMAGATRRVRLGTGVLIVPLRPALLLAKTLATLDALSGGRIDLGVGLGWQPEEFEAAGVPFEDRAARTDDTLRACRALWRDAPATFESPTVSFRDIYCEPRPVQPEGIPIWFGLRLGRRNVARIVELGAGWMPILSDDDELFHGARRLRAAFADAGRDPGQLGVRAPLPAVRGPSGRPDLDASLAALPRLRERGVTLASIPLPTFATRREAIPDVLERIARAER